MNICEVKNQDLIWDFYQNENDEVFINSIVRLNYLISKIRNRKKVLNIGVGAGIFEELALKKGINVYSLDPSERSIKELSIRFGMQDRAKVGYSQDIPFPDNYFDAVVISELIEHLSNENIDKTIKETYRVLDIGGLLIGTVPANENLNEQIVICPDCGKIFHRWGHMQSFNIKRVEVLLSTYYKIEKIYEHPFLARAKHNWKVKIYSNLKTILWKLGFNNLNDGSIVFIAKKIKP